MEKEFREGKIVVGENYNEIVNILNDLGYDVLYFNCTHPFIRLSLDGIASGFMDNKAFNEDKLPLITLDTLKQWLEEHNKEVEFKPFDKILGRDNDNQFWQADLFSHIEPNKNLKYYGVSQVWKYILPYEGNEHLLGTTNNPE